MKRQTAKTGQHWVVVIDGKKTVVLVYAESNRVYPCGDDQGWRFEDVESWVRKVRL